MSKVNLQDLIESQISLAKSKSEISLNDIENAVRKTYTAIQKWIPKEIVPDYGELLLLKRENGTIETGYFLRKRNSFYSDISGDIEFIIEDVVSYRYVIIL